MERLHPAADAEEVRHTNAGSLNEVVVTLPSAPAIGKDTVKFEVVGLTTSGSSASNQT